VRRGGEDGRYDSVLNNRANCPSPALRERVPRAKPAAGEGASGEACCKIACMPDRVAQALRQASTDAEIRLWAALRGRRLAGFKFRRQHAIGRFVVDFACTRHHLIIMADGGSMRTTKPTPNEPDGWRARAGASCASGTTTFCPIPKVCLIGFWRRSAPRRPSPGSLRSRASASPRPHCGRGWRAERAG
jgi:hypothetical protein